MTRINLVDPELLSDAHLGAEYRELPRIFRLVKAAEARGETPESVRRHAPGAYTLGPNHCRFFYTRLLWLARRYEALVAECRKRGRKVTYAEPPAFRLNPNWFGDWEPSAAEVETNVRRIEERGGLRR